MKDSVKKFFSSRGGSKSLWVILWLIEYFFSAWITNFLSGQVISVVIILGYVLLLYAVFYWIKQRRSTECHIYTLLILEFTFNGLNKDQIYTEITRLPFWSIYIIILFYFLLRMLVLERFLHFLQDIYSGFMEARWERIKQKEEDLKKLEEELKKAQKEKRNYVQKKSEQRRSFWASLYNHVADFFYNIVDFFAAIPQGLLRKRITQLEDTDQGDRDKSQDDKPKERKNVDGSEKTPLWFYFVIAIILLFLILLFFILFYYQYQFSLSKPNDDDQSVIFSFFTEIFYHLHNESNIFDFLANITSLILIEVIIFVLLLFVGFIIFIIVVQIIKSGSRMVKDMVKSLKNQEDRDYSSVLFYSIIVFFIGFLIYKLYPFSLNDLSALLATGEIFIYPIMLAIFIPIITTIIDVIKRNAEAAIFSKVKDISNIILDIAIGTLKAILNYIKFVTKDFLMTIQNLSIDEFKENMEDNGNDTKVGNSSLDGSVAGDNSGISDPNKQDKRNPNRV